MNTKSEHHKKSALLAVSGGLDSIVLLHLLASRLFNQPNQTTPGKLTSLIQDFISLTNLSKLELAYIDHSQRSDTEKDIQAIKSLSQHYNLNLHISKLNLPPDVSESLARELRYKELEKIKSKNKLDHLITAHHADDVVETALINLTRGTGPKGLTSLRHHPAGIWRPYLSKLNQKVHINKVDLEQYAKEHQLSWHEDSTNQTDRYLRNRIRQKLFSTPKADQKKLLDLITSQQENNLNASQITEQIIEHLTSNQPDHYNRADFLDLEEDIQNHILHILISQKGYDVNRQSVQRAQEFISTAKTKKILQLKGCDITIATKDSFTVEPARQNKTDK